MWNDTKKKQENFISSASSFREENYNSYIMWSSILISTSYSEEDLYCQSLKKRPPQQKPPPHCGLIVKTYCVLLFFPCDFLCSSQWKNRPVCEFLTKVCDEEENSILLWWKTKMIMVSPVNLWNMIDESSCSGR